MKTCFLLLACLVSLVLSANAVPKTLAGPPSEFESKKLPDPTAGALTGESALLSVQFFSNSTSSALVDSQTDLDVDSTTAWAFSVLSPYAEQLTIALTDPTGKVWDTSKYLYRDSFALGDDIVAVPADSYYISAPFPVGKWSLSITSSVPLTRTVQSATNDAVVLVWNENDVKLYAHLVSYEMAVDNTIGLTARLYDATANPSTRLGAPAALPIAVDAAEMKVMLPDGDIVDVQMHDDGLHGDELANDNIWGATMTAPAAGLYSAQAFFSGYKDDSVLYTRTTQHVLRVVPPSISFTGTATAQENGTMVDIFVGVSYTSSPDDSLYLYSEVWGTDKQGQTVPVAWAAGMVSPQLDVEGGQSVRLSVALEWFDMARANAPLVLRNAYIQNQLVPVATADEIKVSSFSFAPEASPFTGEVTEKMTMGPRPAHLVSSAQAGQTGVLILVHGYCSGDNPFTHYDAWTNSAVFEDLSATRTNDQFARMIMDFAANNGIDSFAITCHSQGGLATAHLHNFYWSGLEVSTGGFIIQSVGSPYAGSGLAGSLASIGDVFGVGCGTNFDLTHDGAALWGNGITSDTRDDIHYYTTQYETSGLLHYCNLAANMVLAWPNDGVAETDYCQFDGAHLESHLKGECHSADMHFPPQCWSAARDAVINSKAARDVINQ
jgi:hypothetical protein